MRVVAAADDERGEADGHHRRHDERERPRHLGDHQHDGERRSGDAAEAGHHPDDDVRRRVVSEARHDRLEQPPDRGADERADHHARAEDATRATRADRQPGRRRCGRRAGRGRSRAGCAGAVRRGSAGSIRTRCRAPRVSPGRCSRRSGRRSPDGPNAGPEGGRRARRCRRSPWRRAGR